MLIPFQTLKQKYPQFQPQGVVHVGAHEAQELPEYHKLGIHKMVFIEANPQIFKRLEMKCAQYPDIICFNECIGDEDGKEVEFNIANNDGQSSSFLELGTHKQMHPEVHFTSKLKMKMTRLDTLLEGIEPEYDFLNMDIQGAEGHALKGLGKMLNQFKYLYLEVNTTAVYENCMQLAEMTIFLHRFGFQLKETLFPGNCTWGDSFWVKND